MSIPKKKKKSLLKTKAEKDDIQKMAVNIRKELGDLGSVAEDFFQNYVNSGMSPKNAYKKMKKKMENFTEKDLQDYLGSN
tara:strand:- start:1577 stop:1816 length:240 start_codon:yes stop_codon:yes gene_type:complete